MWQWVALISLASFPDDTVSDICAQVLEARPQPKMQPVMKSGCGREDFKGEVDVNSIREHRASADEAAVTGCL